MDNNLKIILKELVSEFELDLNDFLKNPKLFYCIKRGNYAAKGSKRIGAHTLNYGACFDQSFLYNLLGRYIQGYQSSRKLYEYVARNNYWPTEYESYEKSLLYGAPMIYCVAGGFLCRNFELNNHQFVISDQSFEIAYSELCDFFKRDYVSYDWYIHLQGASGDLDSMHLTKEVSLVKAGFELACFFSINYGSGDTLHGVEVFEDDYLLKIKFKRPKSEYNFHTASKLWMVEQSQLTKWKNAIILSLPGYINFGKQVRISADWPVIYLKAMGPFGNDKWLFPFHEDGPKLLECDLKTLRNVAKVIKNADFQKKVDNKIVHSLERLTKAKSTSSIDDKVVELAIAWEFLFDTDKQELMLQLRLKLIKLLFEINKDPDVFKKLSDFYTLRSTVVHGSDKLKLKEKDKAVINFTESLIQRACLKLIDLNQKYTMGEIQAALRKSLHLSVTFSQIIKS